MNNNPTNSIKSIVIITMLIGIALTIYSIKLVHDDKDKKVYYILTEATIVDYKKVESSDGGTSYAIVAEYEVNGEKHQISPRISKNMNSLPEKGSTVQIRYNPDSPEEAIFEKDNTWLIVLIFGIVCIVISGIFILALKGIIR